MQKKIREYMSKNQMLDKGDTVLVGISGGGDSVALLQILYDLSEELGFSVRGIHVNHGIRGKEAQRDQDFVEKLCAERKIPLTICRYQVPKLAEKWKTGLEEAGRMAREEAFDAEVAALESQGYKVKIALAHHKDDLAETMVHHLARGSGIRGLGSMRPVFKNRIRPLLCVRRREIEQYLKERQLSFVIDSTNLEDDYTRNRIRHQILPLLEKTVNEKAVDHMAETARMAALAEDYLTRKGKELPGQSAQKDGSILLEEAFFQEEPILQSYGIQEIFFSLTKERKDFSALHVQLVQELFGKQTGKRVMLPYGIQAKRGYGGVLLKRGIEAPDQRSETEEWELSIPGEIYTELGSFEAKIFLYENQKILEKKYTKWLDYDKIEYDLSVRTRRSGDFLIVDQKGSKKKLTRCMIDEKIPKEQRDFLPLVVCGSEVLWMVGGRINERYKITSDTKRVLELKYQGGYKNE